MKVLIVEDEQLAAKKIQKTIIDIDNSITVAGITHTIQSTVNWLKDNPAPDVILLDIELSDGQSFEIYDHLEIKSAAIFITSYDEYALRAFKVNSIDYLLKPIQKDELALALGKYKQLKSLYGNGEAGTHINMDMLIKELRQQLQVKEYRKRFLAKHSNKLVSVETEEIAYFFSDGRLNFFKTKNNDRYVVDYTLDELEKVLNPHNYFRISRPFFVSLDCITQISNYPGNRLQLLVKPDIAKEVVVSREKVTDFKRWMGK